MVLDDDSKRVTKESYNQHAQAFDVYTKIYRGKLKRWIDEFARQCKKGGLVLDVGCGSGRDARYLSDKGFRIVGVDFSEKLIEIAKGKVPNVQFTVMDFEEMQFLEKHFAGIWANASLFHISKERLLPVLKKLRSYLIDKGLLFVNFRIGEGERMTQESRGEVALDRFYAFYKPRELEVMLRKAGFHDLKQEMDRIETGSWVSFFARR